MGAATVAAPTNAQVGTPHRTTFGDRFARFWAVTLSNSYATGGDTVAFTFPKNIDFILFEPVNVDATHVYQAIWDRTNGKLKVINLITGAEVLNTTDLSGVTFRAIAVGKL